MEEKAADALEMAAKENEKREKAEKPAQGEVKKLSLLIISLIVKNHQSETLGM